MQVPKQCHAVDRSRWVMSSALGWPLLDRQENPAHFYPDTDVDELGSGEIFKDLGILKKPYILCFHSTAREAKRWSNAHWISLGESLSSKGYQIVFPWGNLSEKKISVQLASQIEGAIVPEAFSIQEAFPIIASAALTVGVDTGLTHLAAVLGKPTIEIYCDSPRWKTEGYWSDQIINLGDIKAPPTVDAVLSASLKLLAQ